MASWTGIHHWGLFISSYFIATFLTALQIDIINWLFFFFWFKWLWRSVAQLVRYCCYFYTPINFFQVFSLQLATEFTTQCIIETEEKLGGLSTHVWGFCQEKWMHPASFSTGLEWQDIFRCGGALIFSAISFLLFPESESPTISNNSEQKSYLNTPARRNSEIMNWADNDVLIIRFPVGWIELA